MKTINQINSALQNNATINFYRETQADYNNHTRSNWRCRYFKFKMPYCSEEESAPLSIIGNFTYGAAMAEFTQIVTGSRLNDRYSYERDHRQIYYEIESPYSARAIQFQVRITQDLGGIFLSCQTNFAPMNEYCYIYSHKVRSNETFAAIGIKNYFEKQILKKYLFAPGLFREIQIMRNLTKQEAIQWYKDYMKRQMPEPIEAEKAIRKQLRRHKKIVAADDIPTGKLLEVLATSPRYKKTVKAFRHPSIFALSEAYSYQYDQDGHEEEFLADEFEQYGENAIFI